MSEKIDPAKPVTDMSQMPPDPFGSINFHEELYGSNIEAHSGNRDAALNELLGVDYEYAHTSGLINNFYYNPDTGEDGLMHVLGGEYFVSKTGSRIPRGFHHEPSAEVAWVQDAQGNKLEKPVTYVDRDHLKGKNNLKRQEFRELPYAPYHARVVIDGLKKMTPAKSRVTGEMGLFETNNGMFPKQYDALTVMKAIVTARNTRDKDNDKHDTSNKIIMTVGHAPMLDSEAKTHSDEHKSLMEIRLILDAATEKVMSAYPIVRKKTMKLTKEDIKKHLGLNH